MKRRNREKTVEGAEAVNIQEKSQKEKPKKEKKPQKQKSEQYVMKKNTTMRVLRVCLWGMLILVFIRGVVSIFQRNKEDVVDAMISDFKANYSEFTNRNEEVMSFAQNFVKEYLTYEARGEEEYKRRLQAYVAEDFWSSSVQDFRSAAKAVYVNAYRLEEYSQNQVDVYVQAEVEYTLQVREGESYTEETSRSPVTLKVPVYCTGGSYVVEGIPQFVSDTVKLSGYRADSYYGDASLSEEETDKIKTSIQNFLKAYLEADESVIYYYLDSGADKEKFKGLDGRFTLQSLEEIKCYKNAGSTAIVCLVSYKITDVQNNAVMLQKINLTMREAGGKYYIVTMDTRTGNLDFH